MGRPGAWSRVSVSGSVRLSLPVVPALPHLACRAPQSLPGPACHHCACCPAVAHTFSLRSSGHLVCALVCVCVSVCAPPLLGLGVLPRPSISVHVSGGCACVQLCGSERGRAHQAVPSQPAPAARSPHASCCPPPPSRASPPGALPEPQLDRDSSFPEWHGVGAGRAAGGASSLQARGRSLSGKAPRRAGWGPVNTTKPACHALGEVSGYRGAHL